MRLRAVHPLPRSCLLLLLFLLLVLVAALGVACSGSGRPASRSAPLASKISTCPTEQLSASFRAEDGSTGHYHGALIFLNHGRSPCRLVTTVRLQMAGADGRPLETSTSVDTSTGRPTPVVLAPSKTGSMQVTWIEISSGEACATPASLTLIPANGAQELVVAWPADHNLVCGHGALTLQPPQRGIPRV